MMETGATPHSPSARKSQAAARAVLALLLGLGVWLTRTISVNPVQEARVELPVTILGVLPEGMAPKPEPDKVTITVLGQSASVGAERLRASLAAQVDPSAIDSTGQVVVTVSGDVPGVDVLNVSPETISLRTLDSKLVTVRVRVTGPDASSVPTPAASPSEVKITGPKEIVDRVVAVEAQVRAPALLRQGWDDSYYILLLGEADKSVDQTQVTLEPARVRVNAAVPSVSVHVTAVTTGAPDAGKRLGRVTVAPPSIQVSGPPEQLQALTSIETAPIDLTGRASSFEVTTSLRPPDGITPYRESTVKVSIEILGP
jgi:YbbR domain-containing protein